MFHLKAGEGAMNGAAGMNALHDFLTDVAALTEMEGTLLGGLLGKVAVAEIDAIAGNSSGHAQNLEGFQAQGRGARYGQTIPDGAHVFGSKPQLIKRE